MAALETVGDYISDARVLLQDTVEPYRYADTELIANLNRAFLEIRRLRPDVVMSTFTTTLPSYTLPIETVDLDVQYRVAALYYICGQAQLRDDEVTQDQRATVFINKFLTQMLSIQS